MHQGLADVALTFYEATLPEGATPEIATYWDQVRTGARDEDELNHDHAFDYVLPFLGHFWDADATDPANSRYDDPTLGTYPNAYQKARRVWAMAIGEYTQGRKAEAYHYLGHVTHLLGDMSVPAHVHLDEHGVTGDDSFEDWMYAGNDVPGPEALAALEALGPIDLGAEPAAETRGDALFWLMYTTNQYADFFPSDSNDGDAVSGPWAWSTLDLADLEAEFADPLTAADLDVNDVDDTDALGHLSTIRDHVYVRGVRATAALFGLFDEAVHGTTVTVVINSVREVSPAHWWIPRHDVVGGPDYYAKVRVDSGLGGFGGMAGENRGNQVGNDGSITSDREIRTGWSFGTVVQPGSQRLAVAIDIYDADTNVPVYENADDHSDVSPMGDRTLDLEVDVEKCITGEAGAIYGVADDTGLVLQDPNAAGRCGLYTNIAAGGSDADRSQLAFTIAMTPPAGTAVTTTTVTSTPRVSVPGGTVTWTATVTGAADLGDVAFVADGRAIPGCEARPLVGSVATCASADLAVGSHVVSATYLGFPGYGSSSGELAHDQIVAPILGVGPVTFEPTTIAVGDGPIDVVIADLDGTAQLEVAALVFNPAYPGPNTGDVAIVRADGTAFSLDQTIHTTGQGAEGIDARDIDADGYLDLAIANKSSSNILVGRGRAPGADGSLTYTWLSFPVADPSGGTPGAVAIGDVDRLYGLDLATTIFKSDKVAIGRDGSAAGLQYQWTQLATGDGPIGVKVADVSGDGIDDVVVANTGGTVAVHLGRVTPGTFDPAVQYAVGQGIDEVEIADLNDDGRADLIVANPAAASVSVLTGAGIPGRFDAAVSYAAGPGPVRVAIGDLNLDGRPDIAVAHNNGTASMLLAIEGGGYVATSPIPVGAGPSAIAIGQVDTGAFDVVTADYYGDTITVLHNATTAQGATTTVLAACPAPPVDPADPEDGVAPEVPEAAAACPAPDPGSTAGAVFGQPVVLRAAVAPAIGSGVVQFRVDGSPVDACVAQPLIEGEGEDAGTYAATCTVYGLPVGQHVVEAEFGGTAGLASSAGTLAGDLTIAKKPLAVDAVGATKTYGTSEPAFTWTLRGFVAGDDAATAEVTGSAVCTRIDGTEDVGGGYLYRYTDKITCAPGTLNSESYTFETGWSAGFTIEPATLRVNAMSTTKMFGDPDPTLTWQLSGFVGDEDAAAAQVTGEPVCSRSPGETVAGGPYAITCRPGTLLAPNYRIVAGSPAELTITQRPSLRVDADPKSKVYGGPDPELTATLTGFLPGDGPSTIGITGTPECTRDAGETVNGGPYTITCTPGTLAASDYTFEAGSAAALTIEPATLSVDAVGAGMTYGAPDPALEWTLAGFVDDEDASTAGVTGVASCSRAPGADVAGSPYAVICTPGTLAAPNYTFESGDPADLTITKAPSTTVVSCPAGPVTYTGLAQTPCSVKVAGAGGLEQSPDPVYADNVNAGTASARFAYPGDGNHEASTGEATFTIDKAAPACTIVGWTGTFDGALHGATGACLGVAGESLEGLDLGVSFANVPGGTAGWTFTDETGNYTDDVGTADIVIGKADTTVTVTCPAGPSTYNGSPIEPCTASVTGPGGLSQALSVAYANNTYAGLATASASYGGSDNHNGSADATTFTIDKADTTLSVASASSVYSEQAVEVNLAATVSNASTAAPVNEGAVAFTIKDGSTTVVEGTSAMVDAGMASTQLNLPAGTAVGSYSIEAVYNPGGNFGGSSGSSTLTVVQRSTAIAVSDATVVFGQPAVTLHATVAADTPTPGSTVNQGTVTFTLTDGSAVLGTATTSATVVDGAASVAYAIPVGTAAGSYTIEATYSGTPDLGTSSATAKALTIGKKATSITVSAAPNPVQYSDATVVTATVVPDTAGGEDPTGSVELTIDGTSVGSASVGSDGVATLTIAMSLPAGTYPVAATFTSTNPNFAGSSTTAPHDLVVAKEDAVVEYTGDSLGLVEANLTLQATVSDSAAAGYAGVDPETGADASIGTITRMWVRFDIFTGASCGVGTPLATPTVQVVDTGPTGDGIGTATTVFTSASEGPYCVTARIVGSAGGAGNLYYTAPLAQTATLVFYDSIGQFVTGGGWVADPSGGHGNFGFTARYNKKGQPQGQVVYVWRGLYGGVPADFKIKSNALDALSFTGQVYPLSATLQGKATLQVTRASDGVQLYSSGNGTFVATAFDTNKTPSIGSDTFTLTFTENGAGVPYKSFTAAPLKGGNVVIHLK